MRLPEVVPLILLSQDSGSPPQLERQRLSQITPKIKEALSKSNVMLGLEFCGCETTRDNVGHFIAMRGMRLVVLAS